MLAAENRSAPLTSQIWERKAFAARTNSAAGRAWRPSSLTIVISCRITTHFRRFAFGNVRGSWLPQVRMPVAVIAPTRAAAFPR